jgi:hypothetical protein
MSRKIGWLAVVVALALPAFAAPKPGSITGQVRDSSGVPQMGAIVQVLSSAAVAVTVFTDARGTYTAAGLAPGIYHVKVSAPSFLPAMYENVSVGSGARLVVNVTLNTLFEALQLLPARKQNTQDDDDWKWTLRATANRPILRVLDDAPLVVVSKAGAKNERVLKAGVAFLAGSTADGYGSSGDVTTSFNLERSLFSAGTLSLNGNVGAGQGAVTNTVVRAAYRHQMPDGSAPELALTMRRFATPGAAVHDLALQALAMSLSDGTTVGGVLDLNFGTEFQAIQFMGRVNAIKPFGSADLHLTRNTVLEYQYATAQPNTRHQKGFDSAPADLSESGPRMSIAGTGPLLERARHQEISLSQRVGKNRLQLAAYADRFANSALTGVSPDVLQDATYLLPDIYSGTFSYMGGSLNTNGVRAVYQRKFNDFLTATMDYSYGGVLDLIGDNVNWDNSATSFRKEIRHALAGKVSGTMPRTHTFWIASYRWTSGRALSPVDAFNASAGQADPYLNLFVRQPLPGATFLPGKMEALVDVRNLLAQGYVPVMGQDGHTLYLVQSARAVRGGIAFVF